MIVSANLDKATGKIYKQIAKLRKYGWFSKDVQEMIKNKYEGKKTLITQLSEITEERDKIEEQMKEIAKKINKIK